jgi:hypothetical protein
VAAAPTTDEIFTIAFPFAARKLYDVRIVLSGESHLEGFKFNSVTLFGIHLGFLELSNHPIIHHPNISFTAK